MNILMDACSIINLSNANCLRLVSTIPNYQLAVSPAVVNECNVGAATEIIELEAAGLIEFVDPDVVPLERFFELLQTLSLGEGETECIALLEIQDCLLCCDDRKARRCAADMFGAERLMGSLRLLKFAVGSGLFNADDAYGFYETMKACGGFLPIIEREYFTYH